MSKLKNIRWGIIGVGDVCELKSGPAFNQVEGSQLVAVMRRNGDLARDFAHRHRVPRWYDNADDLFNDPQVNSIYIATPPRYHASYSVAAARTGRPVYVEKPMAMNFAQCEQMISAAEAAGVPLFVSYYRRALPRFLKLKSLIDSGAIGQPQTLDSCYRRPAKPEDKLSPLPWRLNPNDAPGGYFEDLAPHTIDILQFLLGQISRAAGQTENRAGLYQVPDYVQAEFQFNCGAKGHGEWDFAAAETMDRTIIDGSRGRVEFSIFGDSPILLLDDNGKMEFKFTNPHTIQRPMISRIVRSLQQGDMEFANGRSAAQTNLVMDWILSS